LLVELSEKGCAQLPFVPLLNHLDSHGIIVARLLKSDGGIRWDQHRIDLAQITQLSPLEIYLVRLMPNSQNQGHVLVISGGLIYDPSCDDVIPVFQFGLWVRQVLPPELLQNIFLFQIRGARWP
jgi:hypothetical protein